MSRWKAGGYVVVQYATDHPPLHVHVFRDGAEVAKYDLEHGTFMWCAPGHDGRILKALRAVGLIE